MSDDLLTSENWRQYAKAAVEELPAEVSESVGWGESTAGTVEISVAVVPEERSHSTLVRRIRIECVDDKHPYVRVGEKGGQFHLNFADAEKFRRHIQTAILGELCRGGMIEQEGDSATIRYISKSDGSTILEWRK